MKNDRVMPKSYIMPILCQLMAILAKCFEISTSNLFCLSFTLTLIYKPSLKSKNFELKFFWRPKSKINHE